MDLATNHTFRDAEGIAEAIFEAIADPVFVIDFESDGLAPRFRYVNTAACELLARSREELAAMRPGLVDDLSPAERDVLYDELVRTGKTTFETSMIASDGRRVPVEIHASDARVAGQHVCIAVARSLVARKEADERMREAKEAAEAANQAKSEFLATMSHEIRTPLHGVVGFASLLDGAEVTDRMREAVDGIRDSANLLLALVTDVLDFSRIEAGLLEIQAEAIDLTGRLRRLQSLFKLRAAEKGLGFRYTESPSLPERVMADSLRIEQVLGNLLSNALKFTDSGSISLEVQASRIGAGEKCRITFVVTDTGIGIGESQQARLFQPFSQTDSSPARRHGGSGLGLVIVRKLCELMGGGASVRSELGFGSTFTASLLVAVAPSESGGAAEALRQEEIDARLRILVAEDNPLNQRLLLRMLESLGCTADVAGDGRDALSASQRQAYDLIFMDVNMPVMTGLEATRAIREHERAANLPACRIVALSAGVSESEREACAESGMDDFLGKPFTRDGLRLALSRSTLAWRDR